MLPSNPTPADYKPSYGDFAKDKTTEHLGQFNTGIDAVGGSGRF